MSRLLIVIAVVAFAGCYADGVRLDLDFDRLARVELRAGETLLRAWIARDEEAIAKGFAVMEQDRLEPEADGAIPAMLYVLPEPALPELRLRMVPMDLATLDAQGRVLGLARLPETPDAPAATRYLLEAPSPALEHARLQPGRVVEGLPGAP